MHETDKVPSQAIKWYSEDLEKVRFMIRRGKSIEFIQSYTGMPLHMIEAQQRLVEASLKRYTKLESDTFYHNPLVDSMPLTKQEERELEYGLNYTAKARRGIERRNRNFIRAQRDAGLLPREFAIKAGFIRLGKREGN